MKPKDVLALSQINRRLKKIERASNEMKVRPGWIVYMRQALNMTLKKLAACSGVSFTTVAQAERGEAASKITVGTLR